MNDMAWILGIGFAFFMVVFVYFNASLGGKKKTAAVWDVARRTLPEAFFTHRHGSEAMLETERTIYLVKSVVFHPEHELIVTNRTYWCVNDKPSQWRRSSKPVLIPGVEEFLSWCPETAKRIVRIGVVTPGCRNITFHVNESDVIVVDPTTDVYGYRLMRLSDLSAFLRKAERK
jgi:hypothetical protein